MKLSPQQIAQAVAEARKIVAEHSTGFINYNHMVSDDQLTAALTRVLGAVSVPPVPNTASGNHPAAEPTKP